jgi:hypothetical protein
MKDRRADAAEIRAGLAAFIRSEIEAAQTPADMLALMRGYLVEFDRSAARFPELDCDKSRQVRAELVEEIARLEQLNKH